MARVVLLAGGTGGAKLARGLLDEVGAGLTIVANTGDDVEMYGGHVSPDPDLVTFWLADRIDARGWGLAGDTFAAMEQLRELSEEAWFQLGDRDLAICLWRATRMAREERPTMIADDLRRAFGVQARVRPMSDAPVRTYVRARGAWRGFQEFMIRERAQGPVEDVAYVGSGSARPTDEVLTAIEAADTVLIGPSNPVISIGPILAVDGMRSALAAAAAPVVAVSPLVRGAVVKGPTDAFMAWAGHPLSSAGIATHYAGVIDGLVADEPCEAVPTLVVDVEMSDAEGRQRVARAALAHARALGGGS